MLDIVGWTGGSKTHEKAKMVVQRVCDRQMTPLPAAAGTHAGRDAISDAVERPLTAGPGNIFGAGMTPRVCARARVCQHFWYELISVRGGARIPTRANVWDDGF